MGVCICSMFCCTLLYVHSSIAIILVGKRELVALLNLSSWCLVMVEWLFLAVPWDCLRFVIVVFPDHTHLLFWIITIKAFVFISQFRGVILRLFRQIDKNLNQGYNLIKVYVFDVKIFTTFRSYIYIYTRKEPTQARKYFMIVNLPLFCI